MFKKTIPFIVLATGLLVGACSDDDKPEVCDQKTYVNSCSKDIALKCVDNRVVKIECANGCNLGGTACKTSSAAQPVGGCGDISSLGVCDGNIAKKCVNDSVQSTTCKLGQTCGKGADGSVACIDSTQPPVDNPPAGNKYVDGAACGNVDVHGLCYEGSAVYCADDNLLTVKKCDKKCDKKANGDYDCVDDTKPPVEPTTVGKYKEGAACGDVDGHGLCYEGHAIFCAEEKVLSVTKCDKACGKLDNGDYDCVDEVKPGYVNGAACGDVTVAGLCDGKTLVYCENSKLNVSTCNDTEVCAYSRNTKEFGCAVKNAEYIDGTVCGDIDTKGICKDKTAIYCDTDNLLTVRECNEACGKNSDGSVGCK